MYRCRQSCTSGEKQYRSWPVPRLLVAVWLVASMVGCQSWDWRTPPVLARQPTVDEVISSINLNVGSVRLLLANDVGITVQSGERVTRRIATAVGTHLALRGRLAVQKPRYLRLVAGTSFSRELDLGSNDREFWLYLRKAQEPSLGPGTHPVLYHATYEEYRRSGAELPLQPEWVIAALGILEVDPTASHLLQPGDRDTVELATPTTLTNGMPAVLVRVVSLRSGLVTQVRLEQSAAVIATSELSEFQQFPEVGAVLATKIRLTWHPTATRVTLDLRDLQVNPQLSSQQLARLWESPYPYLVPNGLATAINVARAAARPQAAPSGAQLQYPYEPISP